MTEMVLWSAIALILYAYIGYPCALALLSTVRNRPVRKTAATPPVSYIITAHNEESRIAAKLQNALSQDYPGELEIIVASDCSTDRTDDIVRGFAPHVRLVRAAERRGKEAAQHLAIARVFRPNPRLLGCGDAPRLHRDLDARRELRRSHRRLRQQHRSRHRGRRHRRRRGRVCALRDAAPAAGDARQQPRRSERLALRRAPRGVRPLGERPPERLQHRAEQHGARAPRRDRSRGRRLLPEPARRPPRAGAQDPDGRPRHCACCRPTCSCSTSFGIPCSRGS